MQVHVPTIYLLVGVLYLLLPATVWLVLAGQRAETALRWCVGGVLSGIGMLSIGLRANLPDWITYSLGNYALWAGNLLLIDALGRMLNRRFNTRQMLGAWLIFGLVFEFFRLALENPTLRFLWTGCVLIGLLSTLAYLSAQLSKEEGVRSARWLSMAYGLSAFFLGIRLLRVLLNGALPDAIAGELDSVFIVSAGVMTAVLGNFAFVAVFLERASHRLLMITQERARREASERLGAQIAQLDRQRTLGAMSASFAHELSQPLTAILMDAQSTKIALQDPTIDRQSIQRSVDDIEHSANRVVALVDRIRNFIRPAHVHKESVNLSELAQEVTVLLARDIRHSGVVFEFDFEVGDWTVEGDRIQLSQILLNVYRNAIQAMAEVSHRLIRVTGERTELSMVLRVQDSGPGVAQTLKGKVGTPFMTSKAEGLGVGFSISKAIAENHGGHLSIANVPGGGAVVELSLPWPGRAT